MNVQQQYHQDRPIHPKKKKRKGGLKRFFRGYLMCAGALATGYVLLQLIVLFLVEIGKWM